ncbi:MAG: protein kinase [Blastocatellia bacterium]|nr:protein kinase [Blastocatellia bacterium]
MPYCSHCGNQTGNGDPYCGECGARQEAVPLGSTPLVVPPKPTGVANNAPMNFQLAPGTVLADRYQIQQRVGGGGMGSVYKATDRNLAHRVVAIKEMLELFADQTARAKAIEDFKRESELLARLEHPSIPTIYDYFFDLTRGRYYLVMKFIDGGDLATYHQAAGGVVDEITVTRWAVQICDVMDYIHSQKPPLIYRDLKPANLMLDARTQRVMLVDFGIARFVAPTQKGVTAVGTMGYAPPELFAGKATPASDLYSLGATMFHLLTGKDPQDNPLLIFDFTKNPSPRQINPALTERMEQIICRAVEHEATQRFPTARAFGMELEAHLNDLKAGNITSDVPAIVPAIAPVATPIIERRVESEQSAVPPSLTCVTCGEAISLGDVFCAYCGTPLQSGQRSTNTARLIVLGTNEIAAQFPLNAEGELLIGRPDPNNGVVPAVDLSRYDKVGGVSRRHARIITRGQQFIIEDLGSSNGTFINDKIRLGPSTQHVLQSGDLVRLGSTSLRFMIN